MIRHKQSRSLPACLPVNHAKTVSYIIGYYLQLLKHLRDDSDKYVLNNDFVEVPVNATSNPSLFLILMVAGTYYGR
jgi:hypothetical protein